MSGICAHCGKPGVVREDSHYHYHCEAEIRAKANRRKIPALEEKKKNLESRIKKIDDEIRELL